mmetsp:Transcript_1071/g.1704  ORF Transcript_1071/g.1704 Transcript_1071/m.1704 type:complete len:116 (-) Transcript_1071:6-353(-)
MGQTRCTSVLRRMELTHLLCALTTNAAGELDVLGHDGHTLGMDGAQIRVFEQTYEVRLGGFLKRQHSGALETQIRLEVLSDFTNKTLEWKLPDQKFRTLLVLPNFTKCNGSYSKN